MLLKISNNPMDIKYLFLYKLEKLFYPLNIFNSCHLNYVIFKMSYIIILLCNFNSHLA
jgi:hypothetical protein